MNKYSVVQKMPFPRAAVNPRSRAQVAATRKLLAFNRRRRGHRPIPRRLKRRATGFHGLPIKLLAKHKGAWRTVAAFQGTPKGIRRAKQYARKYSRFERVPVRLIRA